MKSLCIIAENDQLEWSTLRFDAPYSAIRNQIHYVKYGDEFGVGALYSVVKDVEQIQILERSPDYMLVGAETTNANLDKVFQKLQLSNGTETPLVKESVIGLNVSAVYRSLNLTSWYDAIPDLAGALHKHYFTHLLTDLSMRSRIDGVYVEFTGGEVTIFVLQNRILKYLNTYKYIRTEEAIYYLLLTFHICDLDVENMRVLLLGGIEKESALYREMRQYFRQLEFFRVPESDMPDYYRYWAHISVHRLFRLRYADH